MQASGPETGFAFAFLFALLLGVLVSLVWSSVWVYRDATQRGDQYAAIWTVGNILAFPWVLVVYLIVRSSKGR